LEITAAVILVGTVSFVDDIKPLSQLPRFVSQLIAVGLVFYDLNLFIESLFGYYNCRVADSWVNAFNFMDGINGITVLYALTLLSVFLFCQ
jgi:UDP-N-acetylmuramyl pentapeptide phosphotransferase/UDP-N-acetylglucosamine-1-phosphate transferase